MRCNSFVIKCGISSLKIPRCSSNPDTPQNQHNTLCAKNHITFDDFTLYKKWRRIYSICWNVIICNRTSMRRDCGNRVLTTKNRQTAFVSGLPVVGVTMFSDTIGIYRIERHHRHYRHDYIWTIKENVDTQIVPACGWLTAYKMLKEWRWWRWWQCFWDMAREYILITVIIVTSVTESEKGVWGFPRNAFVDIQTLCLQNTSTPPKKR